MKRYRVLLQGMHFWMEWDDQLAPHGWYTTRWVEAEDINEAAARAIETIRVEPKIQELMVNQGKPRPHIRADEVEEVERFPVGRTLKPGLGFYLESDEEGRTGARELTLEDREA